MIGPFMSPQGGLEHSMDENDLPETAIPITSAEEQRDIYNDQKEKEAFLTELESQRSMKEPLRGSLMTSEKAKLILEDVKKEYGFSSNKHAVLAVGVLCQLGGTARNCDGTLSYPVGTSHPNLKTIKEIFKKRSEKKGLRKFVRKYADVIGEMMEALNIPGNLSKKIQRSHPNIKFSRRELVWMSDFLVEARNIPERSKIHVLETFQRKR